MSMGIGRGVVLVRFLMVERDSLFVKMPVLEDVSDVSGGGWAARVGCGSRWGAALRGGLLGEGFAGRYG
jgi:hypothetical protein